MKPRVSTNMPLLRLVRFTTFGILCLVAIICLASFGAFEKLKTHLFSVTHTFDVQEKLELTMASLTDAETGQRGFLLTGQERYLAPNLAAIPKIEGLLGELRAIVHEDPEQLQDLNKLEDLVHAKLAELQKTIDLKKSGQVKEAMNLVLTDMGQQMMEKLRGQVRQMTDRERARLEERRVQRDRWLDFASWINLGGMVICLFVGVIISMHVSRRLEPLSPCADLAESIGRGDLSCSLIPVMADDEIGQVSLNLNKMLENLREMFRHTRQATENLNAATQQILTSSREQAAGTQSQAAALQQTTATMEEISQSANQIAERSRQVAATAEVTSTASAAGLEAVQKTSKSMSAIRQQAETMAENILGVSEKTQAIGDIIATVNEIAERSNLLALNAAIEAAAVGEAGRSFAVVASEMKSLADQCKEATVQVRSILSEIQKGINRSVLLTEEAVKRVDLGVESNERSDQTIRRLVSSVEESVRVFQQIVAATNQQMIGFEQVTMALLSIRQATDNSAIGTRQLEGAASNLSNLGEQLRLTTESYRL
jgi:methyl-accepting chemotaxis protein